MRESLILRTHLARESISGIRKARDTLDKVPIDKRQISIPKMSVLIVAFLKEEKKKNRVEREEENKLPNHSLT